MSANDFLDENTAYMNSTKGITLATAGKYIPHEIKVLPNAEYKVLFDDITKLNIEDIFNVNKVNDNITITGATDSTSLYASNLATLNLAKVENKKTNITGDASLVFDKLNKSNVEFPKFKNIIENGELVRDYPQLSAGSGEVTITREENENDSFKFIGETGVTAETGYSNSNYLQLTNTYKYTVSALQIGMLHENGGWFCLEGNYSSTLRDAVTNSYTEPTEYLKEISLGGKRLTISDIDLNNGGYLKGTVKDSSSTAITSIEMTKESINFTSVPSLYNFTYNFVIMNTNSTMNIGSKDNNFTSTVKLLDGKLKATNFAAELTIDSFQDGAYISVEDKVLKKDSTTGAIVFTY